MDDDAAPMTLVSLLTNEILSEESVVVVVDDRQECDEIKTNSYFYYRSSPARAGPSSLSGCA
jgi:hypothetical protein